MKHVRVPSGAVASILAVLVVATSGAHEAPQPGPTGHEPARPPAAGIAATTGDPAVDGFWLPDTLPWYSDPRAVVDPEGDRLLLFEPFGPTTRVWSLALDGSAPAKLLAPAGSPPPAIHDATLVCDPDSARIVMFGGWQRATFGIRSAVDSLYELRLRPQLEWRRPQPAGLRPFARSGHVAVMDRSRRRMLIQGGLFTRPFESRRDFNDVWALGLGDTLRWDSLTILGTGPGPVVGTTAFAAIDDARDRMLLGDSGNDTTWTLSLAGQPAWSFTVHHGARPLTRSLSVIAADPVGERLVLLGLRDSTSNPVGSAFALDYATLAWSEFPAIPDTVAMPGSPGAAMDPGRGVLWMAGLGERADGVWTIPGNGGTPWTKRFGRGIDPQGAALGALWVDTTTNRACFMGGVIDGVTSDWSTLWSLPLDGDAASRFYWSETTLAAGLSPARSNVAWAYDTRRRSLLVFGGDYPGGGVLADLSRFDLDTMSWQALATSGPTPAPRAGARAVYDAVADRMYMYGGVSASASGSELWSLSLGLTPPHWSLVPATNVPYPGGGQSGEAFALDTRRGRLYVFGGSNPANADVWTLDPSANPPTWSLLGTAGAPPPGRGYASLVYDPIADRLLVVGGLPGTGLPDSLSEVWSLSLSGTPTWEHLHPDLRPPDRAMHAAAYDAEHDRMLVYGSFATRDRDLRILQWQRDRTLPPPLPGPRSRLQLTVLSNPTPANVALAVGLVENGDVRVELIDPSGRRAFTTTFPGMAAGPHVLTVAPGLRAGVYWIRVRQGGREASARIAILP